MHKLIGAYFRYKTSEPCERSRLAVEDDGFGLSADGRVSQKRRQLGVQMALAAG